MLNIRNAHLCFLAEGEMDSSWKSHPAKKTARTVICSCREASDATCESGAHILNQGAQHHLSMAI